MDDTTSSASNHPKSSCPELGRLAIVLTTVACREDADRLANALLDRELAACVQIDGPLSSHYRWQGERHCDEEYRLVIKTTSQVWPELKSVLPELHPYQEPQLLLLSVQDATSGYGDWVISQTRPA